ncbi:methionine-binding lipoprotein MetQ [Paraliobacillus ryukyuensis]|uniref:D-methionine transport system substrate-binding protein n=1 Tax=Paraliobacillus ryukyuensis TaxID=200904 RepID=A0A366EE39_9BACI|nr:MetQ/NlpA family ABC transporter substrate-binding protein [Paraliobacillus ryukyuensis]RBP00684.1 D-methionine transport system substrate-binding protein [Paraliobacillus ryukyuensis]
MKKLLILLVLTMFSLAACGDKEASDEKKDIIIGFGVGTYEEQFRNGILPLLEEQGYNVEIKVFSQNMQVNPAMAEGAIEASVFQSTAYMEGINDELGIDMVRLNYVPGAPQSLRSVNHEALDEVKDGSTVALPNDPVNQERAVRILEDLGWVKVAKDAGTTDFNINSVSAGDYDISFEILDPAQILASLEDVDYGVVNGNYIANSGQKISDGLAVEDTPMEHRIIVSVLAEDQDTEWAKDLKAAYESVAFEDYILSEGKFDGFILPEAWESN